MNGLKHVKAGWWFALALVALTGVAASGPAPMQLDVQLVWGTDLEKSPDTKHKVVDETLAKRLSKSPFKWKHYFEVNRLPAEVPANQSKQLRLSDHCTVDIKNLGDGRIEVKLQGDGKPVSRNIEPLPDDWPLILSGAAPGDTAWLVVIQKIAAKPPAK